VGKCEKHAKYDCVGFGVGGGGVQRRVKGRILLYHVRGGRVAEREGRVSSGCGRGLVSGLKNKVGGRTGAWGSKLCTDYLAGGWINGVWVA